MHGTNADIVEVNKLVKQPFKSKRKYKSQGYKKACKHSHSKEKTCTRCEKKDTYQINFNLRKVKSAESVEN